VHGLLKDAVKAAGLKEEIRVNHSGCLNQCGYGPMIVVYPDDVWYAGVDPSGAKRIAREHLLGDEPVERYRYKPEGPGNNKR